MDGAVRVDAVSETLFLPLYALALESQRADPILTDPGAVDLTRQLNRSFAGSDLRLHKKLVAGDLPATLVTTMALRIRRYDRYVRSSWPGSPTGSWSTSGAAWMIGGGASTTVGSGGSTWTYLM